jgi:hypothetical protein
MIGQTRAIYGWRFVRRRLAAVAPARFAPVRFGGSVMENNRQ